MLLVVVQAGPWEYKDNCVKPMDTKPEPTADSTTSREPCHKLDLGRLTRRRLQGCFTYHDKVILLRKYYVKVINLQVNVH